MSRWGALFEDWLFRVGIISAVHQTDPVNRDYCKPDCQGCFEEAVRRG